VQNWTDWPFAGAKNPAEDDPERQHDDDEDSAGTDGHERLEDEPRVEVDAVERADTSRRRVREQSTMQQHHCRHTYHTVIIIIIIIAPGAQLTKATPQIFNRQTQC